MPSTKTPSIELLKEFTLQLIDKDKDIRRRSKYFTALIGIQEILINNGDQSLNKLLTLIGDTMEVDRAYIYENKTSDMQNQAVLLKEWCAHGIISCQDDDEVPRLNYSENPFFIGSLFENSHYMISESETMEEGLKKFLLAKYSKSTLIVPLFVKDYFFGFIGVDMCIETRDWDELDTILLKTIANSLELYLHGKKMEKSLSHSVKMLDNTLYGMVITDLDANIEYANSVFCKMYGYTLDELLGKNMRMFKSGMHTREEYENLWNVLLSGKEWSGYIYNKHKSGTIHRERTTITPVRIPSEEQIFNYVAIKEPLEDYADAT